MEWQAVLARLTLLEQLPAQLTEAQDQLKALQAEMTAVATKFDQQLKEQVQNQEDCSQGQLSATGQCTEVHSGGSQPACLEQKHGYTWVPQHTSCQQHSCSGRRGQDVD